MPDRLQPPTEKEKGFAVYSKGPITFFPYALIGEITATHHAVFKAKIAEDSEMESELGKLSWFYTTVSANPSVCPLESTWQEVFDFLVAFARKREMRAHALPLMAFFKHELLVYKEHRMLMIPELQPLVAEVKNAHVKIREEEEAGADDAAAA